MVDAPGLPGVVGETKTWTGSQYRVLVIGPGPDPGVTGACSEYTGQLTDDC